MGIMTYDRLGFSCYHRFDEHGDAHRVAAYGDGYVIASASTSSIIRLSSTLEIVDQWTAPGRGDVDAELFETSCHARGEARVVLMPSPVVPL